MLLAMSGASRRNNLCSLDEMCRTVNSDDTRESLGKLIGATSHCTAQVESSNISKLTSEVLQC